MSTQPLEPPIDFGAKLNLPSLYKKTSTARAQEEERLAAWTALEALEPTLYREPDSGGSIEKCQISPLPWLATEGTSSDKKQKACYEIFFGFINLGSATNGLVKKYKEHERDYEKPLRTNQQAAIASIMVDLSGVPIGKDSIAVSSFAWAFPLALKKEFAAMVSWPEVEPRVRSAIFEAFPAGKADEPAPPIDDAWIKGIRRELVTAFQLPGDLVTAPTIALRHQIKGKNDKTPALQMLNSFFLEDLAQAARRWRDRTLGPAAKRYLGRGQPVNTPKDILNNPMEVEAAVAPARFPLGRWPAKGGYALALLQQAAVNIAIAAGADDNHGLVAINGPPGTGKTTLLRDVIAHFIVERANQMAAFDNPEEAFTDTNKTHAIGRWKANFYKLDKRLKGFEMLVASSNNKAVENISRELPGMEEIAEVGGSKPRYFRRVSDDLAKTGETWGLIAAVLGNSSNRKNFARTFWPKPPHRSDTSFNSRLFDLADSKYRKHAQKHFTEAKKHYHKLQRDIRASLDEAQKHRDRYRALAPLRSRQADWVRQAIARGDELAALFRPNHPFNVHWSAKDPDATSFDFVLNDRRARPGWLHRLLRLKKGRAWLGLQTANHNIGVFRDTLKQRKHDLEPKKPDLCGEHMLDDAFLGEDMSHEDRQIAAPWLSKKLHRKREELFVVALELHEAFIEAAAYRVRRNLAILIDVFDGRGFQDPEKDALLPDLWSTLFLVVPVLSTTFASSHRMLGLLPPESIGWLIIDEAGQATPAAAMGSIMRAKRVLAVGDPIQIQPIIQLPERLIVETCKQFNVKRDNWSAPTASVQTLADRACEYQSVFEDGRRVGVPLLVHRRCQDPMFSVSNKIAYDGLMVHAVPPAPEDTIRAVLGASKWHHVSGSGSEHWCPEEGEYVVEMLEELARQGIQGKDMDIFVITPFRKVANEMRNLLKKNKTLLSFLPEQFPKNNIGTIHTVQGRDAGTVIFLLGAPSKASARQWAGTPVNLVNVAVSRAKRQLYVVGSRQAWKTAGAVSDLSNELP